VFQIIGLLDNGADATRHATMQQPVTDLEELPDT
jgi:hypothetical protein